MNVEMSRCGSPCDRLIFQPEYNLKMCSLEMLKTLEILSYCVLLHNHYGALLYFYYHQYFETILRFF